MTNKNLFGLKMFIPTEVNFEPQCFKLDVQITVLQYEPHGP